MHNCLEDSTLQILYDGYVLPSFVQLEEGGWEMYDATEKPKKIGTEYAHVSGFRNGVSLVSEKGKPVSIIDTDGKTKKLLDKIDNKEVAGVRAFEDGYAVFMTVDSLYGVIDQDGDCVYILCTMWTCCCYSFSLVVAGSFYASLFSVSEGLMFIMLLTSRYTLVPVV